MNKLNLWSTVYERSIQPCEYLYHYTRIDAAYKILVTNSLKFSSLSKSNDTVEKKLRVKVEDEEVKSEILRMISTNISFIKLLCFSMDHVFEGNIDELGLTEERRYSDYTGRGFALPRMWAQYSNDNNGVCLAFDKTKLLEMFMKQHFGAKILEGEVKYISPYAADEEISLEMVQYVKNHVEGGRIDEALAVCNILKEFQDFTKNNFLTKTDDWSSENEYRILAYSENSLYINGINEALSGIVVGENIDETDLSIIRMLSNKKPIMKIEFCYSGCKLNRA